VLVAKGNIRSAAEILAELKYIATDSSPAAEHPLGFLTSERRDVWSRLREKLLAAGNNKLLHHFVLGVQLEGVDRKC